MDTPGSLHPKPSEETLASLLQLDPTPMAESPTANVMDKQPLARLPDDDERVGADPEKSLSEPEPRDAGTRRHRGTTGPISFRTLETSKPDMEKRER